MLPKVSKIPKPTKKITKEILNTVFAITIKEINPSTAQAPNIPNCFNVRKPTILNSKLVTFCGIACCCIALYYIKKIQ